MPLTDTAIKAFKPKEKVYREFDGGGLYLEITPKGAKLWRLKYRFGGKEKRLAFGVYPIVGLKEARERREQAKKQLDQGIDPGQAKKESKATAIAEDRKQQNTFKALALEWFEAYSRDLSARHVIKLRRYLDSTLFPAFGSRPVDELVPADVLDAARPAQEKGNIQTAHRLVQLSGQVLQYAVIKGVVQVNVASGVTRALQPVRITNYPTITDPKEIGRLLRAIHGYKGFPVIVYYLKILPYVFTRPGELRLAEWADIDLDGALFTVPWQRMKTRKASPKDHQVPLARQVVALFRELYEFSGQGRFVFPSVRAKTDTISDAGALNALRDMGYPTEAIVPHGFRSMASTRLNEMGYRPDVIEAQLAHKDTDAIRGVYNRAEYMEERRIMMQEWADYLDTLKANSVKPS